MRPNDPEKEWIELQTAGIPLAPHAERVGIDLPDTGEELLIRKSTEYAPIEIRELPSGFFGYILPILIRRDAPGKTILRSVRLSTPGVYTYVEPIDHPMGDRHHPDYYAFPGQAERIPLEYVINDRLRNLTLRRDECIEGLILALGMCPPGNDRKVPIQVAITDQCDEEHTAVLQVPIRLRRARVQAPVTRPRRDLLSKCDTIIQRSRSLPAALVPKQANEQELAEMLPQIQKEMLALGAKYKRQKMLVETDAASGPRQVECPYEGRHKRYR